MMDIILGAIQQTNWEIYSGKSPQIKSATYISYVSHKKLPKVRKKNISDELKFLGVCQIRTLHRSF